MVVDADVGRPVSVTGASRLYARTPVTVWENSVPSVVAPCITSISHRPGWGSGVMSEAFPVGLPGVGVVSVAETSKLNDSGPVGCEVGRREQVVVHRIVGGVVRRGKRHVEVVLTRGHVHIERLDLPGTARY